MTDYGLTSTGFRSKTYTESKTDIETAQRSRISEQLVLDETTVLGNLNAIASEQLAIAWEALEAAAGVLDPDNAVGGAVESLGKLTGVLRLGAQYGTVNCSLTFTTATSIPAETLILSVSGETTNTWTNTEAIAATGAGVLTGIPFRSVTASSAAIAAAGTLTVIATPISGLASATNPLDATPGTDIESIDAFRLRREQSLAATGKGTAAAIASAVAAVDGVVDAQCLENDTDTAVNGIPPHSVRVLVWDGTGLDADDDEIAQAIYDAKAAATQTHGVSSGTATDPWGDSKTIYFDRVTQVLVYIDVTVTGSTSAATVQAAILAAWTATIGTDLVYVSLLAAAFGAAGVTDVTDFQLAAADPPSGEVNLVAASDQILLLDTSRIDVTLA